MKVANWGCFFRLRVHDSRIRVVTTRERYFRVGTRIHGIYEHTRTHHYISMPVPEAGDNGTEKLLITLDHVSSTNYFMSIEIN